MTLVKMLVPQPDGSFFPITVEKGSKVEAAALEKGARYEGDEGPAPKIPLPSRPEVAAEESDDAGDEDGGEDGEPEKSPGD